MILHDATMVVLKRDRDIINSGIHINNGLIVLEMDGQPTRKECEDFLLERCVEDAPFTVRNITFMTMEKWAELLAMETLARISYMSKESTWIIDEPKVEVKLKWWEKILQKGLKK